MNTGQAIGVHCPKCRAEPGEPCVSRARGGRAHPAPGPHAERYDAACDHPLSRLRGVNGSHLSCGCGRRWKLSPSEAERFRRAIEENQADAVRGRQAETA